VSGSVAAPAAASAGDRAALGPVPFAAGTRSVFLLTLDGMVWSARSVILALLLGLPLLLALVFRFGLAAGWRLPTTGFDVYALLVARYDVGVVLPLCALFFASALIADEVDGKTLTYLLTRPVPRGAILLGKFLAYLVSTLVYVWPITVLTFFLLATDRPGVGGRIPTLFQDLGVTALALLAYGALFALLGVLVRWPVIPGLLFVFVWENVAYLPGHLPKLTVTAPLRSLLEHQPGEEGLGQFLAFNSLSVGVSLASLAVITVGALALAFWIFGRREYVIEQ
jgi:ABC-type transport system involved in multi-copper enzyme maturation permease subunit